MIDLLLLANAACALNPESPKRVTVTPYGSQVRLSAGQYAGEGATTDEAALHLATLLQEKCGGIAEAGDTLAAITGKLYQTRALKLRDEELQRRIDLHTQDINDICKQHSDTCDLLRERADTNNRLYCDTLRELEKTQELCNETALRESSLIVENHQLRTAFDTLFEKHQRLYGELTREMNRSTTTMHDMHDACNEKDATIESLRRELREANERHATKIESLRETINQLNNKTTGEF